MQGDEEGFEKLYKNTICKLQTPFAIPSAFADFPIAHGFEVPALQDDPKKETAVASKLADRLFF